MVGPRLIYAPWSEAGAERATEVLEAFRPDGQRRLSEAQQARTLRFQPHAILRLANHTFASRRIESTFE